MMGFVGAGRSHARRDALDPMLIEAAERAGERRL